MSDLNQKEPYKILSKETEDWLIKLLANSNPSKQSLFLNIDKEGSTPLWSFYDTGVICIKSPDFIAMYGGYGYWGNPELVEKTESYDCTHEWVNVGFNLLKEVCQHCDIDKPKDKP